jgi:hypothetical protein
MHDKTVKEAKEEEMRDLKTGKVFEGDFRERLMQSQRRMVAAGNHVPWRTSTVCKRR